MNNYGIKKGSKREHINSIYTRLITDETLMRLLYYKPENYRNKIPHPLSDKLKNIVPLDQVVIPECEEYNDKIPYIDEDEYWDIVDDRILTSSKDSNIVEEDVCRLYIYLGRRRPKFGSYYTVDQEIIIDILVHESYENDLRLDWINDRISELITLERITGFGRLDYAGGNPRQAPIGYSKYENIYTFGDGKK